MPEDPVDRCISAIDSKRVARLPCGDWGPLCGRSPHGGRRGHFTAPGSHRLPGAWHEQGRGVVSKLSGVSGVRQTKGSCLGQWVTEDLEIGNKWARESTGALGGRRQVLRGCLCSPSWAGLGVSQPCRVTGTQHTCASWRADPVASYPSGLLHELDLGLFCLNQWHMVRVAGQAGRGQQLWSGLWLPALGSLLWASGAPAPPHAPPAKGASGSRST